MPENRVFTGGGKRVAEQDLGRAGGVRSGDISIYCRHINSFLGENCWQYN